jgi:galactokinase
VKAEKSAATREAYNQRVQDCRDALAGLPVPASGYRELLSRVSVPELLAMAEDHLEDRPRRRFRHVISEATRVLQARQAMIAGDASEFGRLLCESHRSLRDDYEVSHPVVDELVDIAMQAGAWGARITGAGFGGCIVAAVSAEKAEKVVSAFEERFPAFAARASAGARVVDNRVLIW